jgi:hypothetical protein
LKREQLLKQQPDDLNAPGQGTLRKQAHVQVERAGARREEAITLRSPGILTYSDYASGKVSREHGAVLDGARLPATLDVEELIKRDSVNAVPHARENIQLRLYAPGNQISKRQRLLSQPLDPPLALPSGVERVTFNTEYLVRQPRQSIKRPDAACKDNVEVIERVEYRRPAVSAPQTLVYRIASSERLPNAFEHCLAKTKDIFAIRACVTHAR